MKKRVIKITILILIVLMVTSLITLCSFNYLDPNLRKLSFLIPTRFYSNIVGIDARLLEDEKICQIRYLWKLDTNEEEKAISVQKVRDYFSDYLINHQDCFLNDEYEIYVIFEYEKNGIGNSDSISFSNFDPITQKTNAANFTTISVRMHELFCLNYFKDAEILNILPNEELDEVFDISVLKEYSKVKYVIFNDFFISEEIERNVIDEFEIKISKAILNNSPGCTFYYSNSSKIMENLQYLRFLNCSFFFKVIGHMDIAHPPVDGSDFYVRGIG